MVKATPNYALNLQKAKIIHNRKYSAVKIPPRKSDIVFQIRSGVITPRKPKKRDSHSVCGRSCLRLVPIHIQIQKDLRHYLGNNITPMASIKWPSLYNFSIQRNDMIESKNNSYTTSYNSLIKKTNESMPNIFLK
jgi:hypothetical protein